MRTPMPCAAQKGMISSLRRVPRWEEEKERREGREKRRERDGKGERRRRREKRFEPRGGLGRAEDEVVAQLVGGDAHAGGERVLA